MQGYFAAKSYYTENSKNKTPPKNSTKFLITNKIKNDFRDTEKRWAHVTCNGWAHVVPIQSKKVDKPNKIFHNAVLEKCIHSSDKI